MSEGEEKEKQYWLLKTELGEWSWEDQAANEGISKWDGVKNKQAQKYMKSMKLGDLCFFYHSGNKSRKIVGVVSMKGEIGLKGFVLFKQPRLSVVPCSKNIWDKHCEIGGGFTKEDEVKMRERSRSC
ncbi:hypothetical protein MKW92_021383 [Papaver armeniacum]|nr:hypothetical protein MKW92_021383 [Papaver armeniacum]